MALHYVFSENREAHSASSSDFYHNLSIPSHHNRIALVSISLPKSFYLVNSPYNTFKLDSTTYSVPQGNYSVDTFVTAVNALISPSTVSFSRSSGLMTFTSSASTLLIPSGSNLFRQLGFNEGVTYNFSAGTLASVNVVDFQSVSEIYVLSSLVSDPTSYYNDLIYSIYVNDSPQLNYVNFVNPQIEQTGKPLAATNAGQVNDRAQLIPTCPSFKLLDQNGDLINLNGLGVRMVLRTWREDNLYDLMRNYINFQVSLIEEQRLLAETKK